MISIITEFFVLVGVSLKVVFYFIFFSCESLYRLVVWPSLKSLDNETILVTGAANGIGKAICLEILKVTKGKAKIVCWDMNNDLLESLMAELKEMGATAFPYVVDVSNRDQVVATSDAVKFDVGRITMIINNAGIMPVARLLDQSPEIIEKTMAVNVLAHFWIIKEFLPEMIKQNSGHIVAIASAGALITTRNLIPYHSSKFAVNGYMEGLEDELEEYLPQGKCNIKLTTVYPVWVNTSFAENKIQSKLKMLSAFLEPSQVAEKVVSGVRRNYPHIYLPNTLSLLSFLRIAPYKFQLAFKKLVSAYPIPPALEVKIKPSTP